MSADAAAAAAEPRLSAMTRSDVGRVRSVNEDSLLARFPLYLVADGMGGHARGDRASQLAIAEIDRLIPVGEPVDPAELLGAIHSANAAIRSDSETAASGALSGTTLTGIALARVGSGDTHWMVVNVGDSRVYSWNGRSLSQLTTDHSVVQELVDSGLITAGEAEQHPSRNTITRALGAVAEVDVDAWLIPRQGSQTFVVCSDGVTKELDTEALELLLSGFDGRDGGSIADAIVEAALRAGGRDNVTVIVLEAEGATRPTAEESTNGRDLIAELGDTLPRGRR